MDEVRVMKQYKQFEELEVWKAAREVVVDVYLIAREGSLARDYGFRDQLQRAAVSIMANIAEGHERGGNREFVRFLHIAKGSAAEVRALIEISKELGYLADAQKSGLAEKLRSIGRQLGGFIRYLEKDRPDPPADSAQ